MADLEKIADGGRVFDKANTARTHNVASRRRASVLSHSSLEPQHEIPYSSHYIPYPNKWAKYR
jgi:hypothetical protein